jgi:P4 family phage/plasmid primase-like protien
MSSRPGEVELAPLPRWLIDEPSPTRAQPRSDASTPTQLARSGFLVAAFRAAGWLRARLDEQRTVVVCPWSSEHTSGSAGDTSTVLFAPSPGRTMGWFHCSHAHCASRTLRDVLAVLPTAALAEARVAHPATRPPDAGSPSSSAPRTFERGDQVELAWAVLEALGPASVTHDEGDFWRYDEGTGAWARVRVEIVEATLMNFAGAAVGPVGREKPLKLSASAVQGATHLARSVLVADPRRAGFDGAPRGLAFRDGFAVVRDGRLERTAHRPENMCRYAFPFDLAWRAPMPRADEFFEVVFGDVAEEERHARVMLLQEFAGACLIGEAPLYQRCLMLFGAGGNGKSELLRILRGMMPPGSVAALPPHHWGERFQIERLVGALANFCDEVPEREVTSSETFKAVVTGEPIHAERKHRAPFEFRPIAGHVFSTNTPLSAADFSDGFWRRFMVCPLTRRLDTLPARRIAAGAEVLDAELPALVGWALEGAARVQRQGGFTIPPRSAEVAAEWQLENDPVRVFAESRASGETMPALSLYEAFCAFAKTNGFAQMSSTRFGRRVMATGLYTRHETNRSRVYIRKPAA